jgi:hypothetical protein
MPRRHLGAHVVPRSNAVSEENNFDAFAHLRNSASYLP